MARLRDLNVFERDALVLAARKVIVLFVTIVIHLILLPYKVVK